MAGVLGNTIATNHAFAGVRRKFDEQMKSAPKETIANSVVEARALVSGWRAERYEVREFERCQERLKRHHAFRLRSYIVLKLQRAEESDWQFVRIGWTTDGVQIRGPCSDDSSLRRDSGLLYPLLRGYQKVKSPKSALRRLDEEILQTLDSIAFSTSEFNCCHFSNMVQQVLNHTASNDVDELLTDNLEVSLEHLEPVDASGQRIEVWCKAVKKQLETIGSLNGQFVSKPPAQAVLGQGNFGQVWRARDPRSNTMYAVKNMGQKEGKRECELFKHLHNCPHPCVVGLHHMQHFQDARLSCIVMELCTGGDLSQKIVQKRKEALQAGCRYTPPSQARCWVAQILLGLEHLHLRTGTLIRDLKPGNILLTEQGHAKITDFGWGRVGTVSTGVWTLGTPSGTPGYVAPEVLFQENYDFKADLFSFGVLIWVILTGGLNQYLAPQPPSNVRQMRSGKDFSSLFSDWRLLHEVVSDQSGTTAPPLEGEAQELVLKLISRHPAERPSHREIRLHEYVQPLQVPSFESANDAISKWVASVAQNPLFLL